MTSPNTIHIASAFDKNYITPFYVLLTSVFCNNPNNKLIIHSIATGISQEEKNKIEEYVQKNRAEIYFYEVDEDYVRKNVVIPIGSYFTVATYYRLFLPLLVKDKTKKLLYIDTDAVVLKDLNELFNTEMGGFVIAATPDSFPGIRKDLGLTSEDQYFNAGVLLIDIDKWLKENLQERLINFIVTNPEKIIFVDQDALNAVLIDQWLKIDKKYNYMWMDIPYNVPKREIVKDKVIIHYTTAHKPWKFLGTNKLRYIYHYYLNCSPVLNKDRYNDFKLTKNNIQTFIIIRATEIYNEYPSLVKFWNKFKRLSRI